MPQKIYAVVHADTELTFENSLNELAGHGYRVVGSPQRTGGVFFAVMEKEGKP